MTKRIQISTIETMCGAINEQIGIQTTDGTIWFTTDNDSTENTNNVEIMPFEILVNLTNVDMEKKWLQIMTTIDSFKLDEDGYIYNKNGRIMFEYGLCNIMYINDILIWDVFENCYHMSYTEVQHFTKSMLLKYNNLKCHTTKKSMVKMKNTQEPNYAVSLTDDEVQNMIDNGATVYSNGTIKEHVPVTFANLKSIIENTTDTDF